MGLLSDPTVLIIMLVGAILFVIWLYMRGDPQVESPRSQMAILEEALRNRGFKHLIPIARNFGSYKEDQFLEKIQELLVPFSQDKEFIKEWLEPILLSNLDLIMKDQDLLVKLDLHMRKSYGYRLKPIRHIEYGIRPETKLYATREEGDVCFHEKDNVELERGQKVYVPLETKDEE